MANETMTHETLVKLEGVSKHFPVHNFLKKTQYVHAMDDVSLTINKGEILSLVGESGSGKTTTAKIIARLHTPDTGRVLFQNRDIFRKKEWKDKLLYKKQVQMIFQDPFGSLNPTHTLESILKRPFLIHGLADKHNVRECIENVLIKVGMDPPGQYLKCFPHELSGGQRQRINIARVIAVNPMLLLADEPTSMLDVSIRMIIMNMMKQFRDKEGISYLYITHDLAGARYIGDRIAVMYAGMIMEIGNSDDVIRLAHHPYTKLLRSAAPQPEKLFRTTRLTTKGEIPSLINPPSGCRFHPRCPHRKPVCSVEIPAMHEIEENHWVRCVLT